MTTEKSDKPTRELDSLVKAAVEKVNEGSITLNDVLSALSPSQESAEIPAVLPVPPQITSAQNLSVEKVADVFGQVVPTERRALSSTESAALVEEKETLDELKKMAESRQRNIRITVFNHMDVEAEGQEITKEAIRGGDGHYILAGEARGEPDTSKRFTREVRNNAPALSADALKNLVDDPDADFSHEDYLGMTTQVRVMDENKVLLALKKDPRLIVAIAGAVRPGSKSSSMYLRKA